MHTFDTQHEDLIHDAQLDYYGQRLATGSSDRTVRLFKVEPNQPERLVASLTGHEGPVWQVAWAHPKYGSLLASAGYDGRVIIWKEDAASGGSWIRVKEHLLAAGTGCSVNAISWAPHACGLRLACAGSDGRVCVLSYLDDKWRSSAWTAHHIGCNGVSWAPDCGPDSLRLVSAGSDNLVKVWTCADIAAIGSEAGGSADHAALWTAAELAMHSDWVRDVVWSPYSPHLVVSCGQDRSVVVWRLQGAADGWVGNKISETHQFSDTLWRLSFTAHGGLLAVAGGDNHVTMWREGSDGVFELVGDLDQAAF